MKKYYYSTQENDGARGLQPVPLCDPEYSCFEKVVIEKGEVKRTLSGTVEFLLSGHLLLGGQLSKSRKFNKNYYFSGHLSQSYFTSSEDHIVEP